MKQRDVAYWPMATDPGAAMLWSLLGGGFNRSAQHLLILRGEEVCHGDVADLVHGSAEGRAVGAMEERAKCCGHLDGRWKGRTRPALSGSWYSMEGSCRRRAGEPWQH